MKETGCEPTPGFLWMQARAIFGRWHLLVPALLAAAVYTWDAKAAGVVLHLLLRRAEILTVPVLMIMTVGLVFQGDRADELAGVTRVGFWGLYLTRLTLVTLYCGACLAVVLGVGELRTGAVMVGRTLASSLVTALFFSLLAGVVAHATGKPVAGWAGGTILWAGCALWASILCHRCGSPLPYWLPFAGLTDAGPRLLLASKSVYLGVAVALAAANRHFLERGDRLLTARD